MLNWRKLLCERPILCVLGEVGSFNNLGLVMVFAKKDSGVIVIATV